jgi:hypothetical protein
MTTKAVNAATRIVRRPLRRTEIAREMDEERDDADRIDDREQRDQRFDREIHGLPAAPEWRTAANRLKSA